MFSAKDITLHIDLVYRKPPLIEKVTGKVMRKGTYFVVSKPDHNRRKRIEKVYMVYL